MEELVLTDPIVQPEEVTATYKVASLTLDHDVVPVPPPAGQPPEPGLVVIKLKDNLGQPFVQTYTGKTAIDYMKYINTANFSTTSLHKRILQRLSNEGVLPGTVTGAPDPPTAEEPGA